MKRRTTQVILGAALLLLGAVLSYARPKSPRRYGEEKPDDAATVAAYSQASRGLVLRMERRLALRELARWPMEGTLLDVGCGPGYLAVALARRYPALRVTGIDMNAEMVAEARSLARDGHRGPEFYQGDAAALPFPAGYADYVVSTGMLHHLADGRAFLEEAYRVLRPGGRFLVLDLRRDMRRGLALGVRLYQFLAPRPLRAQNAPLGSLRASYTPAEAEALLTASPFRVWRVAAGPAWLLLTGRK